MPDERRGIAGRSMIAHRSVRTVVLHDEEVERGDAAVAAEPDAGAADHAGAPAADLMLLLAADPHHPRRARLLRKQRRDGHRHGATALAAEAAAGVLADD